MGKSISIVIDDELMKKLDSYRAGRKLETGKHCQYTTAVVELLESALDGVEGLEDKNPLPMMLSRIERLERTLLAKQ